MTKTIKLSQREILEKFIDQNSKMIGYMSRLDRTLEAINDQNVLHANTLQANTNILKESVEVRRTTIKLFSFLLIMQAAAIIILAGAEKVFQFLPSLPFFK